MTTALCEATRLVVARDGPWIVVRPDGDLDFWAGAQLDAALRNVVEAGAQVAVDMAGVGFVDPSGLAALLAASREAARRGASLSLIHI